MNACFERTVTARSEDEFLVVGDGSVSPHPCTITLAQAVPRPVLGTRVKVTEGTLEFGCGPSLSLEGMATFSPRLGVATVAPADQVGEALHEARRAARSLPYRGGLHDLFGLGLAQRTGAEGALWDCCYREVSGARRALRRRDEDGLLAACSRLAGLGLGLTPSGDDYVAGLAAALRFCGESTGVTCGQLAEAMAVAVAPNTTPYSAFLVGCASRGLVSRSVADWLGAVVGGRIEEVEAVTVEVSRTGHSSGVDVLAGLVDGVEASLTERTWSA